jgi:hypothetical protein
VCCAEVWKSRVNPGTQNSIRARSAHQVPEAQQVERQAVRDELRDYAMGPDGVLLDGLGRFSTLDQSSCLPGCLHTEEATGPMPVRQTGCS